MNVYFEKFRNGILIGLGIAVGMSMFAVTMLLAQVPNIFSTGSVVSASEINANFAGIVSSLNQRPPIGAIIAWHKDLDGGIPALPDGWVECNGQVIAETSSPINGITVPNLNGDATGVNSPNLTGKYQMFLRGGTTSGVGQADSFRSHSHSTPYWSNVWPSGGWVFNASNPGTYEFNTSTSTGAAGGGETRPFNMSVIWIMRIK